MISTDGPVFVLISRMVNIVRNLESLSISKMLSPPYRRVLDLGCGDGRFFLDKFSRFTDECVGVDLSIEALKRHKKISRYLHAPPYQLVRSDARKLPFRKGSFDLVFLNCVLEHIVEDDEVLRCCAHVIEKDGEILVTVPNSEAKSQDMKRLLFTRIGKLLLADSLRKFEHWSFANEYLSTVCYRQVRTGYDLQELADKLEKCGLAVESSRYYLSRPFILLFDLVSLTKLNRLHPSNLFLAAPFLHILKSFDVGGPTSSGGLAVKAVKVDE